MTREDWGAVAVRICFSMSCSTCRSAPYSRLLAPPKTPQILPHYTATILHLTTTNATIPHHRSELSASSSRTDHCTTLSIQSKHG